MNRQIFTETARVLSVGLGSLVSSIALLMFATTSFDIV